MKEKLIINLSVGKVYLKFLLTMKLIFLLLTIGTLSICAETFSQNEEIGLDFKDVTIREALDKIEKETGYKFFYLDEHLDDSKKFTMNSQKFSVPEFLNYVFSDEEYKFKIFDDKIVVITPLVEGAQEITITGVVADINGEPLPGVNIVEKGTTNGTVSDLEGAYRITVSSPDAVLSFSFIGYLTEDIAVGGRTTVDVSLAEDILSLDEVVVTGYSVERKKDIIGSVTVVDTDEMQKLNSATLGSQLQGRASGVFVQTDGKPGGESKIRIRGFGSFGESEPLYIIDGVPADAVAFNNLNPDDVQSVQVLKDAASASVYGARAASGVIIISTKQGRPGKAQFNVKVFTGINYVNQNDFPDLMNAEEYGDYWWKSYEGAGLAPIHAQYGSGSSPVIPEYVKAGGYGGTYLEELRTSDPTTFASLTNMDNYDFESNQIVKSADTDWYEELFNPAAITNVQFGATGGSESATYALSMSYYDQDDTSNEWFKYNRYTIRANSTFNLFKSLRVGENLQIAYTGTKGDGTGTMTRYMNPLIPVWDEMGNPVSGSVAGMGNAQNPIGNRWRDRFDKSSTFNIFGNVFAELTLFNDLIFKTNFGVNNNNYNLWDLTQQTYEHAENTSVSSLERTMSSASSWTWTNTLNYSKTFGSHSVKVLLGTEAIRNYSDYVTAAREDYDINDNEDFIMLDTGLGTQSNEGDFTRTQLASIFGRLDYAFADKYLINATVRRDGSSKFGANNRYGVFPAFGFGWRISEESFMQQFSWLDDLKIRGSYGIIGNQSGLLAQNQYTRYAKATSSGYAMGGGNSIVPGYSVDAIGNPDARWEKSVNTNIGFDATFLGGKYSLSAEYYIKETEDLLVENQAPYTGSSATQPSVNIGNMTNRGIDINGSVRGKIGELTYNVDANFGLYRNTVNKVLDSDDSYLAGAEDSDMGVITRTEKGFPISYIWGWELDGTFQTEAEASAYAAEYSTPITPAIGRWRIKDTNGDKVIDDNDKIQLGSPHPDFQVGINLSLEYKNFDLSTFIFWNQGGEIFNLMRRDIDMNKFQYNRSTRMLYDSWTTENTGALLPKLDISDTETKNAALDYYVEDVTFVRMRTLQLGYTLPSRMTSSIGMQGMRIYVQAQNLFTLLGGDKPYSGVDPDASYVADDEDYEDLTMGVISSQNPTPKQIVVGVSLNF